MPATAADQASSPAPTRVAGLAAAALASRRSDPAIHGWVMKCKLSLHSKAMKEAVPASPPGGPAPLAGALSGQLPTSLEPLSLV
jgi:hypothetical protein